MSPLAHAKALPDMVSSFLAVAEPETDPAAVSQLHAGLLIAAAQPSSSEQRKVLNRTLGRSGEPRRKRAEQVLEWLELTDVKARFVAPPFAKHREALVRAMEVLAKGGPAHAAFCMTEPGRPKTWAFTDTEDLAAQMEAAKHAGKHGWRSAGQSDGPVRDERELHRTRALYKGVAGLQAWATHADWRRTAK